MESNHSSASYQLGQSVCPVTDRASEWLVIGVETHKKNGSIVRIRRIQGMEEKILDVYDFELAPYIPDKK
ncbi:MAG TPA: hypothetical protein DCE41_17210 [Cytophagales bacterium]|nr:hypothetical protein [Cytophagales bacterium]